MRPLLSANQPNVFISSDLNTAITNSALTNIPVSVESRYEANYNSNDYNYGNLYPYYNNSSATIITEVKNYQGNIIASNRYAVDASGNISSQQSYPNNSYSSPYCNSNFYNNFFGNYNQQSINTIQCSSTFNTSFQGKSLDFPIVFNYSPSNQSVDFVTR
jgi:hypothetical protein